jgi:hypothetical protein
MTRSITINANEITLRLVHRVDDESQQITLSRYGIILGVLVKTRNHPLVRSRTARVHECAIHVAKSG